LKDNVLATAMARECRRLLAAWQRPLPVLPNALTRKHLLWMCQQVEQHADTWGTAKVHRWIGFIQAGILASGILDLDGLKAMFNATRQTHSDAQSNLDDLIDHLDAQTDFHLELGGEG
jgi:hypothetical protein